MAPYGFVLDLMSGCHAYVFVSMSLSVGPRLQLGSRRDKLDSMSDLPRQTHDHQRYKTCRAIDASGHAHALTFSCYQRQLFLTRDRSRLWTIEAIRKACLDHRFHLWAFVLMPEHVHLLVCPAERDYSTSGFLKTLKQSVASKALAFVREQAPEFLARMEDRQPNGKVSHRFWQRARGYDRNVVNPRYVWELIDYIHANPVRRRLCDRAEDWPWSSARFYLSGEPGPLPIDRESLPEDPRTR
ncbi:MAG: transposase [Isosphaeraceae bacterium]